jgi:type IV pilus assembly protein PilP
VTVLLLMLALLALPLSGPLYGAQERASLATGDSSGEANPVPTKLRRDPFRPFTLDLRPEARIPVTPLQRYELGQLTVVATVWDVSPPRAMVEDSFGMGYIITLGTPIGRNGGVVTAIEPQRVLVEERVLDFYGREQINRIVMETPKEEGPSQPERERK